MSNITSMSETVGQIFNVIEEIAAGMQDNDRLQMADFAKKVSDKSGANPKDALAFVAYFARNTDLGYVSRGKNGGFIKGQKQAKPAKAKSSKTPAQESV